MKKILAAVSSILIFLAVFIPFASSNPDGLEKVANTMGVEEPEPAWKGIMQDYSAITGNPYVSTLIAGVLGTLIVLAATFILGKAVTSRKLQGTPDGAS